MILLPCHVIKAKLRGWGIKKCCNFLLQWACKQHWRDSLIFSCGFFAVFRCCVSLSAFRLDLASCCQSSGMHTCVQFHTHQLQLINSCLTPPLCQIVPTRPCGTVGCSYPNRSIVTELCGHDMDPASPATLCRALTTQGALVGKHKQMLQVVTDLQGLNSRVNFISSKPTQLSTQIASLATSSSFTVINKPPCHSCLLSPTQRTLCALTRSWSSWFLWLFFSPVFFYLWSAAH